MCFSFDFLRSFLNPISYQYTPFHTGSICNFIFLVGSSGEGGGEGGSRFSLGNKFPFLPFKRFTFVKKITGKLLSGIVIKL